MTPGFKAAVGSLLLGLAAGTALSVALASILLVTATHHCHWGVWYPAEGSASEDMSAPAVVRCLAEPLMGDVAVIDEIASFGMAGWRIHREGHAPAGFVATGFPLAGAIVAAPKTADVLFRCPDSQSHGSPQCEQLPGDRVLIPLMSSSVVNTLLLGLPISWLITRRRHGRSAWSATTGCAAIALWLVVGLAMACGWAERSNRGAWSTFTTLDDYLADGGEVMVTAPPNANSFRATMRRSWGCRTSLVTFQEIDDAGRLRELATSQLVGVGWPFLALHAHRLPLGSDGPDGPPWGLLMLEPRWRGLIASWVAVGMSVGLLSLGPGWAIRRRRRSTGRCCQCGYPGGAADRCPECGRSALTPNAASAHCAEPERIGHDCGRAERAVHRCSSEHMVE